MSNGKRYRRSFRLTEHSADVRRDVEDELAFYLEMRERELVAEGFSPEEARRRAQDAFGDRASIAVEVARLSAARARRIPGRGR